ncbi:MAG: stage II sporulation protein M [Gorillibacterium sp.]|nr:stage II sporulation protein M [Gorillibacterium sp.]
MQIQHYIRNNKPVWSELEQLLGRFERRKQTIEATDIDQLVLLYRAASAHLAFAQTYYPQDEIQIFLNQLVSRAHHVLHAEQRNSSQRLSDFFKRRFVGYLLERWRPIALAFVLFVLGALAGFIAVWNNPLNLYTILPGSMADHIDPSQVGQNHQDLQSAVTSSTIMTNNIKVAILAFVGGITFGLLTIYVMIYNGLMVGALAAVFWQAGKSYVFWAYILPHGIIELSAIFIAGGAGLYMGYRMISPGIYTRKYMFLRSVQESALLLVGTIPLFVIAGLIEGYLTPSALPLYSKYIIAVATLSALVLYVVYGRINQRRHERLNGMIELGAGGTSPSHSSGKLIKVHHSL